MPDKYLWQPRQSADSLATELRTEIQTAELSPENLKLILGHVEKADAMLLKQQEQIGGLINYLLANMAPGKAAEIMVAAGIDRHELVACWGLSKTMAINAEKAVERKKQELLTN